jgi:hypothetical protein
MPDDRQDADRGAVLVLVLGVLTTGTGIYFSFVRPPMLPEDILFTGVRPELATAQLLAWLQIVFRTWGAFTVGFGVLLTAVGAYLLTGRLAVLRLGIATAILVAFARFLVSNVMLRSDFLWFIAVLFALAVTAAARLLLNTRRP